MRVFILMLCCLQNFGNILTSDGIRCPPNELPTNCKNPCQPTCQKPNPPICNFLVCNPGCVCKPGLLRDEITGKCVSWDRCLKVCPKNEEPKTAENHCEPSCNCGIPGFRCLEPKTRCVCEKGLLRDLRSKICIPKQACVECSANETWGTFPANLACRLTCQNRNHPPFCDQTETLAGCTCKDGYFWDETCKKCVVKCDCPKECGVNEEWSDCGAHPFCRKTRQNSNEGKVCPAVCVPGCVCRKGYVWDEIAKKCVPERLCPKGCGEHQIYKKCSDIHCRETFQRPKPEYCPAICIPGCNCKEGYIWDEISKRCVLKSQCSSVCGQNQEWKSCSDVNCRETCQNPKPKSCTKNCFPGCSCKEGYIWDEVFKVCVKKHQCSKECLKNQVWHECSDKNCRRTCRSQKPKACTKICISGCNCKDGYVYDESVKQCVRKWECSKACGKGEEWCEFVPDDVPTCQSLQRSPCTGRDCAIPAMVALRPGCVCVKGYIRDEMSGDCVLLKDCPGVPAVEADLTVLNGGIDSENEPTATPETTPTSSAGETAATTTTEGPLDEFTPTPLV